jgi:pyruvate,water dikinase
MPPFEMEGGGPIMRAMFKGELAAPSKDKSEANTVKGFAGSAGVVRGRARVIRSLAEAGRLQPGDVLVAPATEPPWTPLFATAAAVVTDNGGVLSHTAVVAREFRIPAVVGTGRATSTFSDGQLLEVDGDAGVVRVVIEVEDSEREPALVG